MSASDLILATALLTAPVGTPENTPHEEDWPTVRDAIHKLAVDWEIMDPRETRYVLATRQDFEPDLNLLRTRLEDLHDAPRLSDCQHLPDRRTVNELIKFNRAFKKHIEDRMLWELDRADVFNMALQETDRLYKQWDALRDAQCDFYYVTVRRNALKRYKAWVGEADFMTGKAPDIAPPWAFEKR